jgi:hypothetical protein
MEHHTRGKLNEQVQVEKVRVERFFFSNIQDLCITALIKGKKVLEIYQTANYQSYRRATEKKNKTTN